MKRLISLAFVAVFAAFVACEKENTVSPVKEHKIISATIPAGGLTTRVALTQDETDKKLIKLSWEDTDVITVNGVDFVIVPTSISADGKTADFDSGSAPDPTPDGAGKYNITCSNLPGSFTSQTQASDGSTDHLRYGVIITGADSYADVTFSEAWASQHGATIALSSVLRLRALLPAAIASTVKKVIIKASEDDFAGGKTLEVTLTNPGTAGTDNILDVYATLPAAADITTSDDVDLVIQFQVSNNENDKYTAYRKIAAGTDFIKPGAAQYIGIDCSNITSYANASNAEIGSSSNPYLIGDQHQMDYLHTAMESGTTYVKMVDDVDMTGVSWTPLNASDPYDKGIDFNGNGKTISKLSSSGKYASFTGVLYGNVYNVTFDHATISTDKTNAGVVAGYVGTGTGPIKGNCRNITVKNSELTSSADYIGGIAARLANINGTFEGCKVFDTQINADKKRYVGGLFGYIAVACTVEKSCFNGSVSGGHDVGGIVGSTANVNVNISNCYTSGSIGGSSGYQRRGGIVGELGTGGSVVNCYSTASVSTDRVCGGIVARACSGTWSTTSASGNTISGCIAFNPSVSASGKGDFGSSGAVVGFTSCKNTLSNCYRLYNMTYSNSNNTSEYITTMVDQPNCDGTNWTLGTTIGTKASYQCPYYGVAAANDATVKSIALTLGWSSDVWDFSESLPTLK